MVSNGGTAVKVAKGVAVVLIERVSVANGCGVAVYELCVAMESNVCAAEVYNAFKVAAGCGVEAANGAQARMIVKTRTGSESLLKYVYIRFSI